MHVDRRVSFTLSSIALAGDDAARLVYRAELVLQGDGAADLPAGLPVSAYVKAP